MVLYDEDEDNSKVLKPGTRIATDRIRCWTMADLQINIRLSGAGASKRTHFDPTTLPIALTCS
jgi:hypothetical protein